MAMAKVGRSSWKVRALAILGAAAVALLALLGVPWDRLDAPSESPAPEPSVRTASIAPPVREIPPPLSGNDSSVSAEARHLILTGTLVAADPADSRAFLGTDPKNPQTYANSSMLVNGTRIQAIARDHVLLERDGRVVRLDIGGAFSESPPEVRRLTNVAAAIPASQPLPQPETSALTEVLGVSPVFDENGALASYRLRPGRLGGAFTRWGLAPGDQLIGLEGAPLSDVDSAAFMLELVGQGERVRATVLRNGSRVAILLDGSVIAEEKARVRAAKEGLMSAPPG